MSARETVPEVADQAAVWAIRIDAGSVDPERDAALRRWLEDDPRRRGALLRAEAALSFVDRARALGGVVPKPSPRPIWIRRKLVFLGAALAASLAGVLVLLPGALHYSTGLGQMLNVPLTDGSVVSLNTQSAVDVTMRTKSREITLARGEAWFQVAHDVQRPFVVSAGRVRVRAVGTALTVHRQDHGADVLVADGVVETWTGGKEDELVRVAAGSKAYVDESSSAKPRVEAADVSRALAWREGQIVLEGETLGEAVTQFNRYNAKKLLVADSTLAEEKVVGQFRATEPMTFANAVTTILGAKVTQRGDTIQLSSASRH